MSRPPKVNLPPPHKGPRGWESNLNPNRCKTCQHPLVEEINALLIEGMTSMKAIERAYGVGDWSIANHLNKCLREIVQEARRRQRGDTITSLLEVERATKRILEKSEKKGNHETALRAIQRREAQIKLGAELMGELQEKKPNEVAEQKKREQIERAITMLIQKAKEEGIPLTREEAIDKLGEIEPEVKNYV